MLSEAVVNQEENLSLSFDAVDTKPFSSFEVEEHYNLVIKCPKDIQDLIRASVEPLANNKELVLVPPENYHLTVLIMPSTTTESSLEDLREICRKQDTLDLMIRGLHIRPTGIFANVYSPDRELAALRIKAADCTQTDFDSSNRLANLGWITLGHFIGTASQNTIQYIQHRINDDFGTLGSLPSLYRSSSRQKLGKLVWQLSLQD